MKWCVIAGLDPAIHLLEKFLPRSMDGRIKSGPDGCENFVSGNRLETAFDTRQNLCGKPRATTFCASFVASVRRLRGGRKAADAESPKRRAFTENIPRFGQVV